MIGLESLDFAADEIDLGIVEGGQDADLRVHFSKQLELLHSEIGLHVRGRLGLYKLFIAPIYNSSSVPTPSINICHLYGLFLKYGRIPDDNMYDQLCFIILRTALMMLSSFGVISSSRILAYGMGASTAVTLCTGPLKQSKALVSCTMETNSAPMPCWGNPSSTVTILPVLMTELTIASRSRGLILRRLITSQDTPSFSRILAASREYKTFLEQATIVTSVPSLMIFAFPIGTMKSSLATSSGTQNDTPYRFQFSKNMTGLGSLMAAFSSPLQSSASYGDRVMSPGMLAQQLAKHCECWAATAAAGPFSPLNTIDPLKIPLLMQWTLAQLFRMWSIA